MAALLRRWFRARVGVPLDRMYASLDERQAESEEPAAPGPPSEPRSRRRSV